MYLSQLNAALSVFTCVILAANIYFFLKVKKRADAWEELARMLLEDRKKRANGLPEERK